PFPVVTGFTSGIALLIATSQVKDALGLEMGEVPAEFFERTAAYGEHLPTASPAAIGVTLATLVILVLWPRVNRRVPGPLVGLLAATAGVHLLGLPVETIGERFGELRTTLPAPSLPSVSPSMLAELAGPAFTIAMLGA